MDITWKASVTASYLHAATNLYARRPFQDNQLAQALAEPTRNLIAELKAADLSSVAQMDPALLTMCTIASSGIDNVRQIAKQTIVRLTGLSYVSDELVVRISREISGIQDAFRQHIRQASGSNLIEELKHQGQLLRERWESLGQCLLKSVATMTEPETIPANAQIVMIYPAVGNHAAAHPETKCVTIEYTSPRSTSSLGALRLTWLLSILNGNLPKYTEFIQYPRANQIIALAMVPPTLAAGQEMKLGVCDKTMLHEALQSWRLDHLPCLTTDLEVTTDQIWAWWQQYREGTMSWTVALAALDRML